MVRPIVFSIKELVEMIDSRRKNHFDVNILVSGARGDGKSTLIVKVLKRFTGYKPKDHQVYSRDDVIRLLESQTMGIVFDDEAVNSGYKRNFQQSGQKDLITMVTMYRDHFNIYFSAIPDFFSLDRDLRDMICMHIHIVARGVAVIHIPVKGTLYSQDKWDVQNNAKLEQKWMRIKQVNPNYRIPYHKLSTYKGFLFFDDLPSKQREEYELIKKTKRKEIYDEKLANDSKNSKDSFYPNLLEEVIKGNFNKDSLMQFCRISGRSFTTVQVRLNQLLTDKGQSKTLKYFLKKTHIHKIHNKDKEIINQLE